MKTKTTTENTKPYITNDGNHFKTHDEAALHEESLKLEEKVKKLQQKNDAYYCTSQNDFNLIINYMSHKDIRWDFKQKKYTTTINYSKTDFHGPDWYFFKMKHNTNSTNDYWTESLSNKKKQSDEFYRQFTN